MADGLAHRARALRLLGTGVHTLAAAHGWRTLAAAHGLGPVDLAADGSAPAPGTNLTHNGIRFAEQPRNRNTICSRPMRFDMICEASGIWRRLTKPNHPRTNSRAERMNRTIKDATVKRFHHDRHEQLQTHLADVLAADSLARRLKTLNGLLPHEHVCKIWTSEPD
jgi:hypothetical protein